MDAQDGHTSSAIDQLWFAAELASARGQRSCELIVVEDLLRLGESRAAERALDLANHVDGAWSAAIAAHATAFLSPDEMDLETVAQAFSSIGAWLVAAELWAATSAVRRREGMRAQASKAARTSEELVERCEGPRTAPLALAVARTPLSRREREVAQLAANGATNAELASELSISIRTVESHLYAVYAKLGITDRRQLRDVLQAR